MDATLWRPICRATGLALGLLVLVGCGGTLTHEEPAPSASAVASVATLPATPSVTPGLPLPPEESPTPITVVAPQLPTAVATTTRDAPAMATASGSAEEPSITPTATDPPPTFTPPPPPPPVSGEHLIFGRPVPASATQWTDKAYPYGSTRGGTLQPHYGVEFAVPSGTPVLAAAPGVVRVAGPDDQIAYGPQTNFYGNVVIIEHSASASGLALFTVYGHLSEVHVQVGQTVAAGDELGLSGDSGAAYGPHLHFEVREGANTYFATRNPLLWLRPFEGTGVVAARVLSANGQPAFEAPVTLRRVDGSAPYTASTTYANAPLNSDQLWGENFAVDDVVAGYYEVSAGVDRTTSSENLWVFPGRTNFITLTLP